MASPARHTRAVHREHGETESDLGALQLGRPEHWVLVRVRRRGVAGFVVQMTCFAVVASTALVTAMMLVLYGADDPTLVPSMIMAVIVPAVVAPPVLVFTVRLAAALDRASRLLWDAAHTDPLTDVANRRAFFEAVGRSDGPLGQPFDVAIVDLDAFKVINDRHGHAGGDLALQHVARWLVALAGPDGLVARMGGDEFAVVVPSDTPCDRPTRATFDHDGLVYSVTLGWERCSSAESLDEALRAADQELYARKPPGSGQGAAAAL